LKYNKIKIMHIYIYQSFIKDSLEMNNSWFKIFRNKIKSFIYIYKSLESFSFQLKLFTFINFFPI